MKQYIATLKHCSFFSNKTEEQITNLFSGLTLSSRDFYPGEIIFHQGYQADHLGIVLSGKVEVQKQHFSGELLVMAELSQGDTFGEAVIFAHNQSYPASIVASSARCQVMLLSRSQLLTILQRDEEFMIRFMENLSQRVVMLTERIEILALPSIREKIIHYLNKERKRQGSAKILLHLSKKRLSDYLGVPRPSLSRELKRMQEDGLINYDRNSITIFS